MEVISKLHNCRLATACLNIVEEKAYDFCCCDTNNYKPQVNYLTDSLWSVALIVIIINRQNIKNILKKNSLYDKLHLSHYM